jgi:hypothetical protein
MYSCHKVITLSTFVLILKLSKVSEISKKQNKKKNTVKPLFSNQIIISANKSADQVQTIDSSEIKLNPTIQGATSRKPVKTTE